YFRDEPLSEFALADRPLEVGSGGYCDIVVHDPTLAARALLLEPSGGTVVTYDLTRGARTRRPAQLPLGAPLRVGEHHALVRLARPPRLAGAVGDGPTEGLASRLGEVGEGA